MTRPLSEIIADGEGETIEFKRSFDAQTVEALCAFSNTHGGSVFLGISDMGEVLGVELGKESIQNWINQIKMSTTPSLVPDVLEHAPEGATVVELRIAEVPVKPAAFKGRYYKRVKNSNHQLSVREVADFHLQSVNTSWDCYPDPNHDITRISFDKVNEFIERMNRHRNVAVADAPLDVLRKFELVRENGITQGCFLLFMAGESMSTTIELGRFQTETIIKDTARVKTDLFTEIDTVLDFVTKHISKNVIITGNAQHEERWEYPLDAIREIVLNAIVHRDYRCTSDTVIKIFDDHMEFYNPGRLPPGLTLERLLADDYVSTPRNRQLAAMFKEAGIIEKYGSGIKRVRNAFLATGAPEPRFEEIGEGFRVTIYAITPQKTPQKNPQKTPQKRTEQTLSDRILDQLRQNPTLTRDQIADNLGIKPDTVKEYLAKLRHAGRLIRQGGRKSGVWVVVEQGCGAQNAP